MANLVRPNEVPEPIWNCFVGAYHLANEKLPYIFGAGHPNQGYTFGIKSTKADDCSGWVSDILRHGGILNSHDNESLSTNELINWGLPGEGKYMTVFCINGPELQHTFVEFKIPGYEQYRWSMAAHSGTICGWYKSMSTKGYSARRRRT